MEFGLKPIDADIHHLAWLAGEWRGLVRGERIEEHWSTADCGMMMGMFRWIREDKIWFNEHLTIESEHGGLVMRIKHYYPGMIGWEEKDVSITFDLVQQEGTRTHWLRRGGNPLWIVYERVGDELRSWFQKNSEVASDDMFVFHLANSQ